SHEPEAFARVAKVLLPAAYLNFYLTGEHVADMSDSAGTSWLDTGARDWSDALLDAGGMRRDQMPRLVEGSDKAGALREDLARRWGVGPGAAVAGGAGDNAAAACGTGVLSEGQGFVSLGTSGVLLAARDGYRPAPESALHSFCHAVPATWYQMGVMLSCTDSLNWLARITGARPAELTSALGDCIDCHACVNVCPMGIDIRDGQQLACITCALCIDACDDVMEKIGKPRGLIDYLALSDETRERAGAQPRAVWKHVFRPRVILYTALWSLVGVGLVFALLLRPDVEMTVAPVRNPTFVVLSDGSIRNTYDVRLRNKHGEDRPYALAVEDNANLVITLEGEDDLVVDVPANETYLQRVYVTAPGGTPEAQAERTEFVLRLEDTTTGHVAEKETVFNGRDN
ncbi:4Fe-4S dicluster domain-containing protein, partial [Salipiger sp. HF18]|uniref:4Fe-4S dicluster domain-containing protein n=1 Tax=Salipiger sp. HF18 TaxID=2721557 RepID=UPI0020CACC5D